MDYLIVDTGPLLALAKANMLDNLLATGRCVITLQEVITESARAGPTINAITNWTMPRRRTAKSWL